MMKEAARALETGPLAEISVVAFTVAFLLVLAYAFTRSKAQREEAKHLPLDDEPDVPASHRNN